MFIRLLTVLICSSVSWASPQSKQLPRIDPKGIGGTLILAGSETTETAVKAFVKASGQLEENKNILFFSGGDSQTTQQARRILKGLVPEDRLCQTCDAKEVLHQLDKAQALWIAGKNTEALLPHDDALREFLGSGKAIGTSANIHALGLLPDAHLNVITNDELLERDPHLVVYELDADAALLVRGRLIRNIGPGKVRIRRNTRKGQPPSTLTLSPENPIADLTALRRTARDTTLQPPAKPSKSIVRHGTLILIGGGGMPGGILERFIQLAGGKDSRIIVLPTAAPDPIRKPYRIETAFLKAGAGKVTVLPGRTLAKVESPRYISALEEATGLWFGGGRQWRFVDAYLGTKAHPLMQNVLKRGGVIMGSSAGASIQAEYLVRGNPLSNLDMMALGYERGLNFLPGVAVDQHFSQRNRFNDLKALTKAKPQLLGIGIDESTALIVRKAIGEVAGRGKVFFYDNRASNEPKQSAVSNRERFNLVTRKIIKEVK